MGATSRLCDACALCYDAPPQHDAPEDYSCDMIHAWSFLQVGVRLVLVLCS